MADDPDVRYAGCWIPGGSRVNDGRPEQTGCSDGIDFGEWVSGRDGQAARRPRWEKSGSQ